MKKIIKIICFILLAAALTSCGGKNTVAGDELLKKGNENMLQFSQLKEDETIVTIKTTMGDIKMRVFPEKAPKAVENFLTHAKNGYYDNVLFHRVIKDFMVQTGDPTGTGYGGESIWGEDFQNEVNLELFHFYGAVSMANTGDTCSNSSQFFIVQNNYVSADILGQMEKAGWPKEAVEQYAQVGGTYWLDTKHTVFGQVIEGMDVVEAIASVEVDHNDKPRENVMILTIEVSE